MYARQCESDENVDESPYLSEEAPSYMYARQYESDESGSECASRLPLACELNFSPSSPNCSLVSPSKEYMFDRYVCIEFGGPC